MIKLGKRFNVETKFWDRTEEDPATGCIEWVGPRNKLGYGRVCVTKDRRVYAHRLAWEIDVGEIPEGMCVLHLCDNPPCCNVNHLMVGTIAENNRQAGERDRMQFGSGRYNAKLTEGDVIRIRGDYAAGGVSQYQLAREYGVHVMTINNVTTYRRWKKV